MNRKSAVVSPKQATLYMKKRVTDLARCLESNCADILVYYTIVIVAEVFV